MQDAVEVDAGCAAGAVACQGDLEVLVARDNAGPAGAGIDLQVGAGDVQAIIGGTRVEIDELLVVAARKVQIGVQDDGVIGCVGQATGQAQPLVGVEDVAAADQRAAVRGQRGAAHLIGQATGQSVEMDGRCTR